MIEPRSAGGVRGTAQLDLAPPPCETCLHAPICVLKVALGRVKTAEVSAMPLPDGLSIAVSARVDCRFYNQVKKKRAFSPEGLATVRANAVKAREARAANRATS